MRALITIVLVITASFISAEYLNDMKWPTVGVSVLVRNKAHCLPYFFSCLEKLDYPKDRMYIAIWTDHNSDNSDELVDYWAVINENKYNHIYVHHNKSAGSQYHDESSPTQWTTSRFEHVMQLRDNALSYAREKWADYHLMLDADVYLTNTTILKSLVAKGHPVSSTALKSDGSYSNFWAAMSPSKYYRRNREYRRIRDHEKIGCFDVPMIHSAVLMNMNDPRTTFLTYNYRNLYNYDGPTDDIIIFADSAAVARVPLKICNDVDAPGYIQVPLDAGEDNFKDVEQLINVKLLALAEGHELPLSTLLAAFVQYPEPSKLFLDDIYVINLERRVERREYMEKCLKELGIELKFFKAFDGLTLDLEDLPYDIKLMQGYEDPYHKRPMKTGEIGCFMSHYKIWEEVVQRGLKQVMVLEDDAYFRPYFRLNVRRLIHDIRSVDWDLVYLGRKALKERIEEHVTAFTVKPHYSYWTLGYILSASGARKLLAAKPLENLLPVDEFLPIMFDQHPNDTWKSFFPKRDLIALSSDPLLVEPMRYVNQPGYISDTEVSRVVTEDGRIPYIEVPVPPPAGYEYLEESSEPEMFRKFEL